VQPFKKGPDYIDPSWLAAACGLPCYNLDAYLMGDDGAMRSFAARAAGADIALVEGAMGLYDAPGEGPEGSVAALARLLDAPVILVVNASRMTRSVAALVGGYQSFEPETRIAGVILNQVSGARHEEKLREAIRRYCGIPVVGALARQTAGFVSERHLGLVPAAESEEAESIIEAVWERTRDSLDLDAIMEIAKAAPQAAFDIPAEQGRTRDARCRIGVIRDRVFNFYYPENLEALDRAGADLVFIDSLADAALPEIDGLYIGGGFPELHAEGLEANVSLRQGIASAVEAGMAVYAECAGLMYLSRSIAWKGKRYPMAGVIPARVELSDRPAGHGYIDAEVVRENPFFPVGAHVRGHEFHHSRLIFDGPAEFAYRIRRGHGITGKWDGFSYKNLFASYTHLHALSSPFWAEGFVSALFAPGAFAAGRTSSIRRQQWLKRTSGDRR
jgi:cobyrinic acid a,c-diamide synthase